jgi:threonine dehydrogenase-like Zn-dependent dehydrogenase
MKAVTLQALHQVELRELPTPIPAADQLLIQMAATTICTSDLQDIDHNSFGATLPLTLGHEGAGTVVALGADVTGFTLGDRVVTHPVHPCGTCEACRSGAAHLCIEMGHFGLNLPGTFAEYFVVRQDRARHLPAHVPFAVGALFEPLCVCLQALAQARLRPSDRLLILGDGPFGLIMAHLAQALNLGNLVLAGRHDFRLAHAATSDIPVRTTVYTVNTKGATDLVQTLLDAQAGRGYDAIILATARAPVNALLGALQRKGRMVFFSAVPGETPIDLFAVHVKELELIGACNDEDRLDDALAYLTAHSDSLAELVTHHLPLEEFQSALELAAHAHDQAIKVAMTPASLAGSSTQSYIQ